MKAHQRIIREKFANENNDLFGFPQNVDIKKAVLKEVDFNTAKLIIDKYEWLGKMGTTQYHYGIYFENQLAGVCCFGYFQAMNTEVHNHPYGSYVGNEHAKYGIQLSRGACVWWAHEHSGSKLIAYGLSEMKKRGFKYCIAFSDSQAGEIGTLYQATNWYYLGKTNHVHYDLYYTDGRLYLNDRDMFKKLGFSGKKKIEEYISDKPYLKIKERFAKGRYIKLIGTKNDNKIMLNNLRNKIKEYPKRA